MAQPGIFLWKSSTDMSHGEVYARVLAGTFNAETQAFLHACDVAPDIERILGYDDLIRDLKAAGIWSSILVLTVPGPSRTASSVNLKTAGTYNLSEVGSPQNGQYLGWASQGTGYLTTVNCASVGTVSKNSICVFVDVVGGTPAVTPILHDGTPTVSLFSRYTDGNLYCRLASAGSFSVPNSDGRGLYILSRTDASGYRVYKDGALLGSPVAASVNMTSTPLKLLHDGYSNFHEEPIGIFGIAQGLSSEKCSMLNAILTAYRDRFLPNPFEGWAAQSVVPGGRIDAVCHVGNGRVLCGTRTPSPGMVYTNDICGEGPWLNQGAITADDINWVGANGQTVFAISSTTSSAKLHMNTKSGSGGASEWPVIDNITSTAYPGFYSVYSGCVTKTHLFVAGTAGTVWRYNLDGSGKASMGSVSINGLYRILEGANGRILVNGLQGRYFYSDDKGASWVSGDQLTSGSAPLYAIEYFGNGIWLMGDASGNYWKSYDNGSSFYPRGLLQAGGTDDFTAFGDLFIGSVYNGSNAIAVSSDRGETFCNAGRIENVTQQSGDVLDHVISFSHDGKRRLLGTTTKGYAVTASRDE